MEINLPYKVRAALYIFTAVGTPIVAWLHTIGAIGIDVVNLWSAEVVVVGLLAAFNTKKK